MKTSEVFRAAKAGLKRSPTDRDRTMYICWAIDRVSAPAEVKWPAKKIVMRRLGGQKALGSWLRSKGVPPHVMTYTRVQAHRHAWLDLLIAEFEAKGD